MTASKLRQDIYRILDRVLETGEPRDRVATGDASASWPMMRRAGSTASCVGPTSSSAIPRSRASRLVRRVDGVIRLDTHVVVWLYSGEVSA